MHNDKLNNVDEVASYLSQISDKNLSVFYGAGMSYNSGLPLANELKWCVLKYLCGEEYINMFDLYWEYLKPVPFEKFMEFVFGFAESELSLLEIFKEGIPNSFNHLLAYLLQNGRLKNVMTTNFDLLLEKACSSCNVNISSLYSEENFNIENIKYPCYIKIHGSIEEPKTSRIFLSDITKIENIKCRNRILRYFFESSDEEYIIVLGYSCSDSFDILPFLNNVTKSNKTIIFIEHTNERSRFEYNNLCHLSRFNGINIKCNTDLLIDAWSIKECFSNNIMDSRTPVWHDYIQKLPGCTYSGILTIAALLQHRTLWTESSFLFKDILNKYCNYLPQLLKLKIYSALSFNIYKLLECGSDTSFITDDKYLYIKEADKILRDTPNIDNYMQVTLYIKFAKLLIIDKRFKEVIQLLRKINSIKLDYLDGFCSANTENSLGEIYYYLYKYLKKDIFYYKAKNCYLKSLSFFKTTGGYMLEKGIVLFNLAELLSNKYNANLNIKEINSFLDEAEEIAKLVGIKSLVFDCIRLRHKVNNIKDS